MWHVRDLGAYFKISVAAEVTRLWTWKSVQKKSGSFALPLSGSTINVEISGEDEAQAMDAIEKAFKPES